MSNAIGCPECGYESCVCIRPLCLGMYRSPQSDAENDCSECRYNTPCMDKYNSSKKTSEKAVLKFPMPKCCKDCAVCHPIRGYRTGKVITYWCVYLLADVTEFGDICRYPKCPLETVKE